MEAQEMLPRFQHRRWKTNGWLMESLWTHRNFCQKPKLRTMLILFSFFTQIIYLALKITCIIFAAEGVLLGGVSDMLSAPTYPLLTINEPEVFPLLLIVFFESKFCAQKRNTQLWKMASSFDWQREGCEWEKRCRNKGGLRFYFYRRV